MNKNAESTGIPALNAEFSRKVVKGGAWVFIARFCTQFLVFLKLVILARLLSPKDFGIMGIALLVIAVAERFSQTGLQQALIHRQKQSDEYLDISWTFLLIRGIFLSSLICLTAPAVSFFFNAPESVKVIQIIGLSILFQSLSNIGVIYFQREFDFKKQFFYQSGGELFEFITVIILAFALRNVWALAIGLLAGRIAACILSYLIHPYRPHFNVKFSKIRELFIYGKWLTFSNIFIYIGGFFDNIIVGKVLGAVSLGFYRMAYQISNMPASEITYVISQVAFPAYAKIQHDALKLRKTYMRLFRLTLFVCIPVVVIIGFLADDFTRIFLGNKWLSIVPALQLLVVAGLLKSIASTGSPLFTGIGRTKHEFYMQGARAAIMVLVIIWLTGAFDISGTSFGVVLSSLAMCVVWYFCMNKSTGIALVEYFNILKYHFWGSLFMILTLIFCKRVMNAQQTLFISLTLFILVVLAGILAYIGSIFLLQKAFRDHTFNDDIKFMHQTLINRQKRAI